MSMQTIRVAAVSMDGGLGDPGNSLNSIGDWCGRAKTEGAELVVFPELVVHGHCAPNTWDLAEPVPDGPSIRQLEQLACEHDLVLSVGLSEKEKDIVYNTQVLVGPAGTIGKQRKIHLSRDEVLHYKGGLEMPVLDIGKCRVGTVICYDNTHPETARILALRGADIVIAPHAARLMMWDDDPESAATARRYSREIYHGLRTRARENACFYIIADQTGRAGYVDLYPRDSPNQPHHAGGAFIFGPDGEILAESQADEIRDEMVVATLDAELLNSARRSPNYTLRTRRPELFSELVAEQVES
jgi:predicted amidohydrolase